jgi:hypothetical protein
MSKAKNLKRGDRLQAMVPLKILSVKALAGGLTKIKAEAENSSSLEFSDGGLCLEIICKSYREFSAAPHRRGAGGGHSPEDGPLPSTDLEPAA